MKNQKGFSLVELLLVLAIIGIISGIAVPTVLGQRESARQKATEGAAAAIKGELVSYADGLRKGGTTPSAANVITAVMAMNQFKFPSVKNAYTPTLAPYVSTTAAADGQVGLLSAVATGADNQTYEAITVSFKHSGTTGSAQVTIE